MKKKFLTVILASMIIGMVGCSKVNSTDVSAEAETSGYGMEYTEGNVNIGVCFEDAINTEVNSLEIRYMNGETGELIEEKMIQPVDLKAVYDIGIAIDKLGGANSVTVEYIINGDEANAWSRTYVTPDCGISMNVISYIEDEQRFDSVVCG